MGDIGQPYKKIIFEPLPDDLPVEEPAPVLSPEPEQVPEPVPA